MRIVETDIPGPVVVEPVPIEDERGLFARVFSADELRDAGLTSSVAQCNVSYNREAGTLRGMHLQLAPAAETKLVRCTAGAVLDVAVDVRDGSPTFGRHVAVELSSANRLTLCIPEGFAHGYQTLTPDAEVTYLVTARYSPEHEFGLRHDDPALAIAWPLPIDSVSDKDQSWPLLSERQLADRRLR